MMMTTCLILWIPAAAEVVDDPERGPVVVPLEGTRGEAFEQAERTTTTPIRTVPRVDPRCRRLLNPTSG
jgi:hypothetical protein